MHSPSASKSSASSSSTYLRRSADWTTLLKARLLSFEENSAGKLAAPESTSSTLTSRWSASVTSPRLHARVLLLACLLIRALPSPRMSIRRSLLASFASPLAAASAPRLAATPHLPAARLFHASIARSEKEAGPVKTVYDLLLGPHASAQPPPTSPSASSNAPAGLRGLPSPPNRPQTYQRKSLFQAFLGKGDGRDGRARQQGSVDREAERQSRERNLETAKALERTLRSSRGTAMSGGAAGAGMDVRCTTLDAKGVVSSMVAHVPKDELCRRFAIQPRDLRKLDSGVPTSVPTILSRRECIIFTVLHLRVVITANEVTIFDSIGAEDRYEVLRFIAEILVLTRHLSQLPPRDLRLVPRTCAQNDEQDRSWLAVRVSSARSLPHQRGNGARDGLGERAKPCRRVARPHGGAHRCVTVLLHVVQASYSSIRPSIDRDNLRLLLHYSRKLSVFQKRATLVQECLDELLANDDDLAGMYLTARMHGTPHAANDHEAIELLLESFSKQCEEIVSEVETLEVRRHHLTFAKAVLTRRLRRRTSSTPRTCGCSFTVLSAAMTDCFHSFTASNSSSTRTGTRCSASICASLSPRSA